MQIGDNRVDGMETGTALIRAVIIFLIQLLQCIGCFNNDSLFFCFLLFFFVVLILCSYLLSLFQLKCAVERKVDVINLSYGESSKWANSG